MLKLCNTRPLRNYYGKLNDKCLLSWIIEFGITERILYPYSRTSVARTLMALLPRLFRTRS